MILIPLEYAFLFNGLVGVRCNEPLLENLKIIGTRHAVSLQSDKKT